MNTEITDNMNAERRPWVCYDAECGLCVRWAERFRTTLERHGFRLIPLQSPAVVTLLAVPPDELLNEMRVITRDGRIFGGADALIYLSRVISKPLFMLTRFPGARPLLRTIYRLIARNRTCSAGTCRTLSINASVAAGISPAVEPRRPARRNKRVSVLEWFMVPMRLHSSTGRLSMNSFRMGNPADWLLLLVPVSAAAVIGRHFAPWVYMWMLALAMFFGCKWLCLRRERANGSTISFGKKAAFFFGWIGMDADIFFENRSADIPVRSNANHQPVQFPPPAGAAPPSPITSRRSAAKADGRVRAGFKGKFRSMFGVRCSMFDVPGFTARATLLREWTFAVLKTVLGAALIWAVARIALRINPILAGWTGMLGLILLLHFGLFHLLALAWRSAGVPVTPLMRAPLLSRSLGEFWGERWNTAFNDLAATFLFRPLLRPLGIPAATVLVFLISGLIHDLIISVPARGGYGLPTLYFLLQGAGVLFERTKIARRLGLTRGIRARAWTLLITGAPVFWLFHPIFVRTVILPFLKCIGAT